MRTDSLKLRLFLFGGVSIALALLIAGWGIVRLFERHVERRAEAELDTYIRQISAGINFGPAGQIALNRILADPRFGEPRSGLYWQIQDEVNGKMIRSRSLWDEVLKLPADVLDVGGVHRHVLEGPSHSTLLTRERLVAYPAEDGLPKLRIAVALDTRELEAARATFTRDVLEALILLAGALLAAAWMQIALGLKPLQALRQSVLAVRSGDETRIEVSAPQEVMPLVSAMNSLLDAQKQAMEAAKARAADLAHGFKTPLTALWADAAIVRKSGMTEVAAEIEELATAMRRHVDRELSRVRLQSVDMRQRHKTAIEPVVARLVRTLGRTPKGELLEWHVRIAKDDFVPMHEDDVTELLGNLLDNACKWGNGEVVISAEKKGSVVTIEDDGPGALPSFVDRLGERGLRLDEQAPGSGLGLAIALDIVKVYGGTLTFENRAPHGFRAVVSFLK